MSSEVLSTLISSIIGGLLVAILNYFFSKRRSDAETQKLIAEAEQMRAETEKAKIETIKLTREVEKLGQKVDEVTLASRMSSQVVYDSRTGIQPFDFKGYGNVFNGTTGQGRLLIEPQFFSIERTNVGGGFTVALYRYFYHKRINEFLPKNDLVIGKRKIHLSLEAKITKGTCSVHVYFAPANDFSIVLHGIRVDDWQENQWQKLNLQYEFDPLVDCSLVIFAFDNSATHSFILRNIILTEWSIVG